MPNLLDLPREIRDEIYGFLLDGPRDLPLPKVKTEYGMPLPPLRALSLTKSPASSLHLTCRQLSVEYLQAVYDQTKLQVFVSVNGSEVRIFEDLYLYIPQHVRRQIRRCSLQVLWKPRTGIRKTAVQIMKENLPALCSSLLPLKEMAVEFRFFDARDLKNEIRDGSFVAEELTRLPQQLRVDKATMALTALTKLLRQSRNHHFDMSARTIPDPEYYLTVETYVVWRFSPCAEPYAWEGLFPYASSFASWGEETETMEQLERIITKKFQREHGKLPGRIER